MDVRELYRDHLRQVSEMAERSVSSANSAGPAGSKSGCDGIVFHAGSASCYHADDQAIPFRSVPHFARFVPAPGPDHLLLFRPGRPLKLARVTPSDYWEEPPAAPDHPYAEEVEVVDAPSFEAACVLLGDVTDCAYVGSAPAAAARLGIPEAAVEPPALLAALDWARGFKTPYEVACIREANRIASHGHAAARAGVAEGRSEREIHAAYVAETGALDGETPYPNIVAWDDRSSVLHYQRKRSARPDPGHTFLIDAGASYAGYASDVTRTYARPGAHPVFAHMLDAMEGLQQRLAAAVAADRSFVDLHAEAVRGVATILVDLGILRVDCDQAIDRQLALAFLPHGLGHHLGLQVHDVGGQQITREGVQRHPPSEHPYLRTTRDLDVGHVVTVEPGLYFIPMLLRSHRDGEGSSAFDWTLIDSLIPCGGIRIEDDVHVTPDGPENLTRPFVPGHRDPA